MICIANQQDSYILLLKLQLPQIGGFAPPLSLAVSLWPPLQGRKILWLDEVDVAQLLTLLPMHELH